MKPAQCVGKKGRSGRKGLGEELAYFKKLDKSLPEIVDGLMEIFREGVKSEDRWKREMAIKAASILNSKAPQRVANADGSNLKPVPILGYVSTNHSDKPGDEDEAKSEGGAWGDERE